MADYDLGFRWVMRFHLLSGTRLLSGEYMTTSAWAITFLRSVNDNPPASRKRRRPAPVQVRLPFLTAWEQWEQYAERAARNLADADASPAADDSSEDVWWFRDEPIDPKPPVA